MAAIRPTRPRRAPGELFPRIGLIVTVVLALAMYISYNANDGLPWQSTYTIEADVRNADRLVPHDTVRIGGVQVGQVAKVTAMTSAGGNPPFTRLELKLDASVQRVPADSHLRIRSASVLGATYVDIELGRSRETIAQNGRLALARSKPMVQITDLLGTFDRATADSMQRTFTDVGAGLAGRGEAINATLHATASLLTPLSHVSRTLADPGTRLPEFVDGYEAFASALAPVARPLATGIEQAGTTFGALVRDPDALAGTIEAFPDAEAAATTALERLQPSLDDLAVLMPQLRPAARMLPSTLRRVNSALARGERPLRLLPPFARRLGAMFTALRTLTRARETDGAVRKLTEAIVAIRPVLDSLTPAQRQCNVIGLWGENISSVFGSLGTGEGPSVTNVVVAGLGAENEGVQNARPSSNVALNSLPNANYDECESGNEIYDGKQHLGNPPGLQSNKTLPTAPPAEAVRRAREAGLLDPPSGWEP